MKTKTNLSRRIAIAALALLLLCGTALAANSIQTMQVQYMDIQLVVDGLKVTPKDATGKTVEPFASDGTTYLPVRAVAQALGKDVHWDGETKTVYIGDNIPGVDVNWMTKVPAYNLIHATAYDGADQESFFEAGGRKQTQGVVMECSGRYTWPDYTLQEDSGNTYNAVASWNTDRQYQTMHCTVEHMGNSELNCQMEVWLDGVYSKTIELPYDAPSKALDIALNGVPTVTLKVIPPQDPGKEESFYDGLKSQYAVYNISFS